MKKLFSTLPMKIVAAVAVTAVALGAAATASAWYPNRPTFTVANPAPYVTFDSITDNPNYGDERTFFDAKNSTNTNAGGFADQNHVTNGEVVYLRVYVHNNAASNLNTVPDGKGGYVGVATGTKVRVYLPTATANTLQANAYIDASNATPTEVADSTLFYGDQPFSLSYVPGSAVAYNNANPKGMALNDSIVTSGAPIGYNQADGVVPGCFQYVNLVTLKAVVHMQAPAFTITKEVAIPGQPWTKQVTVHPGDTVSYLLTVNNTGNSVLNDLSVRDKLPVHEHIVSGSTTITNGNHPSGIAAGNDSVVSNGIDIGAYNPGAVAYVKFKATVDPANEMPCGNSTLTNTGTVFQPGNNTTESDTANVVVVGKTCTTPHTPTKPTTPTVLPNTGTGDVIGLFAGVSAAGAVAHRLFLRRLFSRG